MAAMTATETWDFLMDGTRTAHVATVRADAESRGLAAENAKLSFFMAHAPAHSFITDLPAQSLMNA